jgi:hypothetical protein
MSISARRIVGSGIALGMAGLVLATPAHAENLPSTRLAEAPSLSQAQKQAIDLYTAKKATISPAPLAVSGSKRATYYRGSFLMWTRDNVDFGYNGSSVTWTSAYQQAGSVFPNVARNLGISKYYNTTYNDRFRAGNRIGAGIVTPWGDVTVYTSDFVHRLSVYGNGYWNAWSD